PGARDRAAREGRDPGRSAARGDTGRRPAEPCPGVRHRVGSRGAASLLGRDLLSQIGEPVPYALGHHEVALAFVERERLLHRSGCLFTLAGKPEDLGETGERVRVAVEIVGSSTELDCLASETLRLFEVALECKEVRP